MYSLAASSRRSVFAASMASRRDVRWPTWLDEVYMRTRLRPLAQLAISPRCVVGITIEWTSLEARNID